MDDEEVVLEEGELSEDSDNDYTPLERPANYSVLHCVQAQPRCVAEKDSESEEEVSSDSDSDSDPNIKRQKKCKVKVRPRAVARPKGRKYDIWSTRVQEDVLSETLNSCDVTKKDRSRDVETYDYPGMVKTLASDNNYRTSNKRSRDERKNPGVRPIKREAGNERKVKGKGRHILELTVTIDSSSEDIAKDIANKLCEEKEELIMKVVDVFGKDRAIEVFEETRKIEEDGGMMIMNQTRRRTPGGVFLFLVRNHYHITPEQKDKIFSEDKNKQKALYRNKQKKKAEKFKSQLVNMKTEILPELLTRTELLTAESNRSREETEDRDVINPPPTPETDCHENSCDGMESVSAAPDQNHLLECTRGKLASYEDDFLDIGCSHDMDVF